MSETSKIDVRGVKSYKSVSNARKAYESDDIEMSRREHQKPLYNEGHSPAASDYVKSVVFGGLDGIITSFTVVSAAVGSSSGAASVLIFGFSNVLADGFSMGFGEYIAGEAERDNALSERRREEWEVENAFDMEVDEMVQIYEMKGLSHEDATTIVKIISKDPKLFVDFMMTEELGIIINMDDKHGPKKQGLVMFLSFIIFGTVPLLAYVPGKGKGIDGVFLLSCFFATCALLGLGMLKGYLSGVSMVRSSMLMVLNGVISGTFSFTVGACLERLLRSKVSE